MASTIIYCLLNIGLLTHSINFFPVSDRLTERDVTKARLIVFSGSDWCKNCILFKKNVLDTPEFKTFAKENLELVTADFPQKNQLSKEQIAKNEALAEKYNPKGEFPKLVLITGQDSEYKEIPYTNQSSQEFIASHEKHDWSEMKDFKVTRKLMGSVFELIVADDEKKKAERHLEAGISEVIRLEKLLTEFSDASETSIINQSAGAEPVKVSEESYKLVQRCLGLSQLTQGAFDITVGPLKKLYNFKNGNSTFPDSEDLKKALDLVGYEKIHLLADQHLYLPRKAMRIGFSAIGKGYAADRVAKIWRDAGVQSGVINASGDLTVIGDKHDGGQWEIGIADPDHPEKALCYLPLKDVSVATSGNYEQFFMKDGVRFGHTINPKTGLPVTGIKSVTVVGPGAELCDALATAVYVMGTEVGMHLIDQLPGTHCLIIDDRNKISKSVNLNFEYARK